MASYIPFVNSGGDCRRLKFYPDATNLRISLENIDTFKGNLPKKRSLWLDPAVDGYHWILKGKAEGKVEGKAVRPDYSEYIKQFDEYQTLKDESFLKNPDKEKVKIFVTSILEKCKKFKPDWVTVPQLPIEDDTSRNKINKILASTTLDWKLSSGFEGKFIFPLIFTHQNQLKGKTEWRKKLNVAKICYRDSGAYGIWAVDSTLKDQEGSGKFDMRFRQLIEFHKDLRNDFPDSKIICGPYWGMNLILWVRGLCDYPAISLGSAYRYHISGGIRLRSALVRLAIPPLRRWAVRNEDLEEWLNDSLNRLSPTDDAHRQLLDLKKNYSLLAEKEFAAEQVARFYKQWLEKLEGTLPAGRMLALYQDLSSAYVLGKQLGELPKKEAAGRTPEKVAQQFMLNCL